MSHWQAVEELLLTLSSGRGVVFARCACRRCKAAGQTWQLEAEDARPLSEDEAEEAWMLQRQAALRSASRRS